MTFKNNSSFKNDLSINPCADLVFEKLTGKKGASEYKEGPVTWSNELVNHVLEVKCSHPQSDLNKIEENFSNAIGSMNNVLAEFNCQLMPTAMHPWMNPLKDTVLWPHGQKEIYQKYDEIFSCKGHGWSNLQSVHINLPYGNDEEFGKLHAAIRCVLPLIPWLASSSPIVENKKNHLADNRLYYYEHNQEKIPLIAGELIPESVANTQDYHVLLERIYKSIKPYDPKGVLCHSWVNSRGAIPKFEDQAIEIRLMDIQECALADFSLIHFLTLLIMSIVKDDAVLCLSKGLDTAMLKAVLDKSMGYDDFLVPEELSQLFIKHEGALKMNAFIKSLVELHQTSLSPREGEALDIILTKGNLSKRIISRAAESYQKIYADLMHCLQNNQMYA